MSNLVKYFDSLGSLVEVWSEPVPQKREKARVHIGLKYDPEGVTVQRAWSDVGQNLAEAYLAIPDIEKNVSVKDRYSLVLSIIKQEEKKLPTVDDVLSTDVSDLEAFLNNNSNSFDVVCLDGRIQRSKSCLGCK